MTWAKKAFANCNLGQSNICPTRVWINVWLAHKTIYVKPWKYLADLCSASQFGASQDLSGFVPVKHLTKKDDRCVIVSASLAKAETLQAEISNYVYYAPNW
jgi:hypothetical protein